VGDIHLLASCVMPAVSLVIVLCVASVREWWGGNVISPSLLREMAIPITVVYETMEQHIQSVISNDDLSRRDETQGV